MKKRGKIKSNKKIYIKKIIGGLNKREQKVFSLLKFCFMLFLILVLIDAIILTFEDNYKEEVGETPGVSYEKKWEFGSFGLFRFENYDLSNTNIIKLNCSDNSLKEIWDFIFVENSNNISIISDKNSGESCNLSLMYKVKEYNLTYLILLNYSNFNKDAGEIVYTAYGNFSEGFLNEILNVNSSNIKDFNYFHNGDGIIEKAKSGNRNLNDFNDANNEYQSRFKIPAGEWSYASVPPLDDISYYIFEELRRVESAEIYKRAILKRFSNIDFLDYKERTVYPVNLTRIRNISDIVLQGGYNYFRNVIDLDDYFANLGYKDSNISFNYRLSSNLPLFLALTGEGFYEEHKIDFDSRSVPGGIFLMNITLTYPGIGSVTSNSFFVSIYGCNDSDNGMDPYVRGITSNRTRTNSDSCLDEKNIREYYCSYDSIVNNIISCNQSTICRNGVCINDSVNRAPGFLNESCGDIAWKKNYIYVLNMRRCFRDRDGDELTFRYEDINNRNVTIEREVDNNLTLTPDENWEGDGYFYIYANDSEVETRGKVNFLVFNQSYRPPTNITNTTEPGNRTIINNTQQNNITVSVFEIKGPYPSGEETIISIKESQTFSVLNNDYDSIEWFLNGQSVKKASNFYKTQNLDIGNYTIRVEIKKGNEMKLRSWKLIVKKEAPFRKVSVGETVFYLSIIVLCIIIVLVLWLFIIEIKKDKFSHSRVGMYGVKVIASDSKRNYFNLPG